MYLRWIPVVGVFIEVFSKERYFTKEGASPLMFYGSAIWHAVWTAVIVVSHFLKLG